MCADKLKFAVSLYTGITNSYACVHCVQSTDDGYVMTNAHDTDKQSVSCAGNRPQHSGDHQPEDEYKCNKNKDPTQELIVGLLHTARRS